MDLTRQGYPLVSTQSLSDDKNKRTLDLYYIMPRVQCNTNESHECTFVVRYYTYRKRRIGRCGQIEMGEQSGSPVTETCLSTELCGS